MGAKKDRDKQILQHKADKQKELAKNMKKFKVSDEKIAVVEQKQKFYEDWHKKVHDGPDY